MKLELVSSTPDDPDNNFLNKYKINVLVFDVRNSFDFEEKSRNVISIKIRTNIDNIIRMESKKIINSLAIYHNSGVNND